MNLSFPVQRWFRPLIPDEVDDSSDPPVSLKKRVMSATNSAEAFTIEALVAEGRPRDQARKEAAALMAEVRPAIRYLVEDAPLIAVRPMVMLDVARLSDVGTSRRISAVGLGFQAQVALARVELGYMRRAQGSGFPAVGAAVFRLVFQNIL